MIARMVLAVGKEVKADLGLSLNSQVLKIRLNVSVSKFYNSAGIMHGFAIRTRVKM